MNRKATYRIIGNCLILVLLIGVANYLLSHLLKDIFSQMLATGPLLLAATFICGSSYQVLEGKLIRTLIAPIQPSFSFRDGFWLSGYTAFFRLVTFGVGTLLSEVSFYHQRDISYSESMGIASLRIILYKLTAFFYAFSCLLFQATYLWQEQQSLFWLIVSGCTATLAIVVILLCFVMNYRLQEWLLNVAKRHIRREKWRDQLDSFSESIDALRLTMSRVLSSPLLAVQLLGISLLKFLCWYSLPYILFNGFGVDITWFQSFSLISFSTVLAGVLPAPAGVGSFEFVFSYLFQPVAGTVVTVSTLLLYRLATYLLPFLLGFFYVLVEKRRQIQQEIHLLKSEEKDS